MTKPKKTSRRVVAPRLDDFVAELLASMHSFTEVVDAGVEEFDCSERTVAAAIARVRAEWQRASASSVDERRATFLAQLEHAWRLALSAGDYRAIAVMAKTRADVEGIKAVKKVEHSGVLGLRPVAAMSPEERRREIAMLLEKQKAAAGTAAAVTSVKQADAHAELGELKILDAAPVRRGKNAKRVKRRPRVH